MFSSVGTSSSAATITVDLKGGASAVDAASPGDTVLVRPGEYLISEPISFRGKSLRVVSASGPDRTTVRMRDAPSDPDRGSVFLFESGETLDSTVQGFTITGGSGTKIAPDETRRGGGVLCIFGSAATIVNCRIVGNSSVGTMTSDGGGGAAAAYDSALVLRRCVIRENTAVVGGGVAAGEGTLLVEDCDLVGNSTLGAVDACRISGPWCRGGGLYVARNGNFAVLRTRIAENSASRGGGAFVVNTGPIVTFEKCVFLGNLAGGSGGGLGVDQNASVILRNCVFAGNRADGSGGAIWVGQIQEALELYNCTIARNYAFGDPTLHCSSPWPRPVLANSIVWMNEVQGGGTSICFEANWTLMDRSPSFVSEEVYSWEGRMMWEFRGYSYEVPTLIVEPPDLRLREGSPAIDAGDSCAATRTATVASTFPTRFG